VAQTPTTCDLQPRLNELLKKTPIKKLRRLLAEKFQRQPYYRIVSYRIRICGTGRDVYDDDDDGRVSTCLIFVVAANKRNKRIINHNVCRAMTDEPSRTEKLVDARLPPPRSMYTN